MQRHVPRPGCGSVRELIQALPRLRPGLAATAQCSAPLPLRMWYAVHSGRVEGNGMVVVVVVVTAASRVDVVVVVFVRSIRLRTARRRSRPGRPVYTGRQAVSQPIHTVTETRQEMGQECRSRTIQCVSACKSRPGHLCWCL